MAMEATLTRPYSNKACLWSEWARIRRPPRCGVVAVARAPLSASNSLESAWEPARSGFGLRLHVEPLVFQVEVAADP